MEENRREEVLFTIELNEFNRLTLFFEHNVFFGDTQMFEHMMIRKSEKKKTQNAC